MSRTFRLLALAGALALGAVTHAGPQDRHGDWIKPGEFAGKKILIACWYWEGAPGEASAPMNHVPKVLREIGFTVDIAKSPTHLPELAGYDELWLVSGMSASSFDATDVAKVKKFLDAGKGVYVLADNTPCTWEANIVGKGLHGIHVEGDYYGDKTVNVMPPGTVKKMFEEAMKRGDMDKLTELRRAGFLDGKLYAEDHELLSGISQIYEGITLCHLSPTQQIEAILRASDNQPLVGVSTNKKEKIVYDCGFTRLYYRWDDNAATSTQWYRNVAAYLLGKRRADLPQG